MFRTRQDCLLSVKLIVETDLAYIGPYGCLYQGYQNPYVQYVANAFYEPDAFHCIARILPDGYYRPMIRNYSEPNREGHLIGGGSYHCVINHGD
jgi:hypothetical protein